MMKNLVGKLTTVVLLIVMTANACILIHILLLMRTDAVLRENKSSYILPDGLTPEKAKIKWDDSSQTPSGWVVRYTSKGCIYCALDFEWERLVPQLERLNYRTLLLLPKEADQFDEDQIFPESAQQIVFVKMGWIKQFRFTGTPTVVIFDNNGHILWHHRGIMNNNDYNAAEKAIIKNIK